MKDATRPEEEREQAGRYTDDLVGLASWMDQQELPGRGRPIEVTLVSVGTQNRIFEIERPGLRCMLRMPPPGALLERDIGILREWRVLRSLNGTDVPHPEALAMCDDSTVLGRPFYLMEAINGWTLIDEPLPGSAFSGNENFRATLGYEAVEGLVRLSRLDWRAQGLEGFGRPDVYHERQVERWTTFLRRSKQRELPGFSEATDWLEVHRPIDFVPGIMHGDYHFGNILFSFELPARISAIIDWEMATIGDPKLDLAWLLEGWPEDTSRDGAEVKYMNISGMPGRTELVSYYESNSGRQVDDLDYYLVLARWKLAIALEQGFQRANGDPRLESFGETVLDLMRRAAELAESTSYRVTATTYDK